MASTVIVVGGPAGTGKTTQAQLLATQLKCAFIEGDDLHPQANVNKMARGVPLTDEDRWGWLKQLSSEAASTAKGDTANVCVVTCSMLKRVYRDYIKKCAKTAAGEDDVKFRFVFLYTEFNELLKRVEGRKNHFMKSDMVKSQYDIMEIPEGKELVKNGGECVSIDTTGKTPEEMFQEVVVGLQ